MKMILFVLITTYSACSFSSEENVAMNDTPISAVTYKTDQTEPLVEDNNVKSSTYDAQQEIQTGNTTPTELLAFAKTLIGTPYLYASTDPTQGFDCSGFITYVFNHFNIAVPRSSVGFTNVGKEVSLQRAKTGDLILFTGTDSTIRIVGHMGIITENNDHAIKFIHSTSGRQYGVTITPLEKYYMGRFVKVIRVFE